MLQVQKWYLNIWVLDPWAYGTILVLLFVYPWFYFCLLGSSETWINLIINSSLTWWYSKSFVSKVIWIILTYLFLYSIFPCKNCLFKNIILTLHFTFHLYNFFSPQILFVLYLFFKRPYFLTLALSFHLELI